MDQKRLVLAIAISLAILLGFQFLVAPYLPHPAPPPHPVAGAPAKLTPDLSQATTGAALRVDGGVVQYIV